jgi:hypothetical protein
VAFLWSDGWLLQAIALAAKDEAATLAAVIGAADAIQHAIPTSVELHGGLHRLTMAGYVEEVTGRFRLGRLMPPEVAQTMRRAPLDEGSKIAALYLRAEPWRPERPSEGQGGRAEYPGLSSESIRAAYEEYHRSMGEGAG